MCVHLRNDERGGTVYTPHLAISAYWVSLEYYTDFLAARIGVLGHLNRVSSKQSFHSILTDHPLPLKLCRPVTKCNYQLYIPYITQFEVIYPSKWPQPYQLNPRCLCLDSHWKSSSQPKMAQPHANH